MDIWYIKVLERLELISVSLPAMDKELPFHVDNFFRFFFLVRYPVLDMQPSRPNRDF